MSEENVRKREASDEPPDGTVDLPGRDLEQSSQSSSESEVVSEEDAASPTGLQDISVGNFISGGNVWGNVVYGRDVQVSLTPPEPTHGDNRKAQVFLDALRHREEFVGGFLKQALQQANTTFRLSMAFMTAGGLVVLIAAALALTHTHGGTAQPIALVSGLGGLLIGVSGAAFSVRADKARKHPMPWALGV